MIRTFRAIVTSIPASITRRRSRRCTLDIPAAEVSDAVKVLRIQEAIARQLAAIPGVTSVAIGNSVPMGNGGWFDPVSAQDHTYTDGTMPALRRFRFVSPGFFSTMGIPLIAGREFTWDRKLPEDAGSDRLGEFGARILG